MTFKKLNKLSFNIKSLDQMKNSTIIFSVLFFISSLGNAQTEWAPVGATWHFEVANQYMDETSYSSLRIESVADTIFQDQSCKKLLLDGGSCESYNNVFESGGSLYTFKQGDSMYFYNFSESHFQLMMDFSLQIGDTLHVPNLNEVDQFDVDLEFIVDSVSFVEIEDESLKRIYLSTLNPFFEMPDGSTSIYVTETLGIQNYLTFYSYAAALCESLSHSTKLRCYSSPSFGTYQAVDYPCDTSFVITDISEIDSPRIRVYPNPADESISLEIENSQTGEQLEISVLDLQGRQVKTVQIATVGEVEISVDEIPNGVYFLKLTRDQFSHTQRLVITH